MNLSIPGLSMQVSSHPMQKPWQVEIRRMNHKLIILGSAVEDELLEGVWDFGSVDRS